MNKFIEKLFGIDKIKAQTEASLKQAEDAIVLDNTNMTREEQFNLALSWALAKIG